ncbi:MAG: site-specific integrase, partial [Muribaculaceae bacterium]|nr:site-specific integrase [Muribaculaceae bacterium]
MSRRKKDTVSLRTRERAGGKKSIYLDIYSGGKRHYEHLKLYLVPELTKADKAANRETLALAESIRAQYLVKKQAEIFGVTPDHDDEVLFYDFMERIIARKEGTTKTSWENCLSHVVRYHPDRSLKLTDIDKEWVQGFRDYLDTKAMQWSIDGRKHNVAPKHISDGTKALMFQKICSLFNTALKEGLISSNPSMAVERFKEPESDREFLTVDELRRLIQTPPPDKEVARAFLFSCLTGLRWSDISALRWSEVQRMGDGTRLVFRQKKTGSLEYLDINGQAVELMGERGAEDSLVFPDLTAVQTARINVTAWVKAAGINKHITFHCGRHTFAVMMLELGTDLYTLSKLMGHRSIESTQVYAKILDKT